jgi:hypothetical protein
MRFPFTASSGSRASLAYIALALNLLGSGAPLLHVAAHAVHAERIAHDAPLPPSRSHHGAVAVELHQGEDHEADHPSWMHDECVFLGRFEVAFALPSARPLPLLGFAEAVRAPGAPDVGEHRSRAPPPGDPARAPPLA